NIHFNEVSIDEQETISSNKPIYDIVEYSNEIKDVDYQETCSNTSNELVNNMADIINNNNFTNNSNNNSETEDIIEIFIKEANEDMMANPQIKTALETFIRNYKKASNISTGKLLNYLYQTIDKRQKRSIFRTTPLNELENSDHQEIQVRKKRKTVKKPHNLSRNIKANKEN
ncbi:3906_t:CDS:2, partial [Gigaspora rosea]